MAQPPSRMITIRCHAEFLNPKGNSKDVDAYLTVARPKSREELKGALYDVYKSEVKKSAVSANFESFTISVDDLCSGDTQLPLLWSIKDKNFILKDNYVGFASISLSQIMDAVVQPNTRFVLIDTQRQGKEPGYTNSGLLAFDAIAIQ